MRLVNVKAILDIKESGKIDDEVEILVEQRGKTAYAILSHCWGQPQEEVHFKDMEGFARMDQALREKLQLRSGYQKILKSCEQARKDQLQWVWVDTCCINKESSAELSEAINSMFRWYENSYRCYAYLHDVDDTVFPTERGEESRISSKWFTRGWTLQELIAPRDVQFFNKNWTAIGDKRSLAVHLERITRVPVRVLKNGLSSHRPSVAQIMSWASDRVTTREEDRAYSLLGLFGVYMPMLYGEGRNAFRRLQLDIIRMCNDHSIFAWDAGGRIGQSGSVLADDPNFFRNCHDIVKTESRDDEFFKRLERGEDEDEMGPAERLNTFAVTNGGIQIPLSLMPYRGSPSVFRATLECDRRGLPICIDLASYKSTFYRYFGATGILRPIPEFREIYLAYQEERHRFTFKLDARTISHYGFSCCGIFPYEKASTQNTFILSSTSDLVIIVYANSRVNARFAVALGCCFGQDWAHIVCDEPSEQGARLSWEDFAKKAYDQAWTAGPEHARQIAEARSGWPCLIKHAHLPRSIWGVDVINYGGDPQLRDSDDCTVMVDVVQCSGCCEPPTEWRILYGSVKDDLDLPGLMIHTTHSANMDYHDLLVDGVQVRFLATCSPPEIKLGDYGHWDSDRRSFKCEGNIFKEIESLAPQFIVDPTDPALLPAEHSVEGYYPSTRSDTVISSLVRDYVRQPGAGLVLQEPVALSLQNSQHVACLIKALSSRLTDRYLVTTIVQCSACNHPESLEEQDETMEYPMHPSPSLNSASCPGDPLIKSRIVTSLYALAKPHLWRQGGADIDTRSRFEEIRSQFYGLLGLYPSDGTEDSEDGENQETSSSGEEQSDPLTFFKDLFGGEDLKDYVGDICFFGQLAPDPDTSTANESDAETEEGANPDLSEHEPDASGSSSATINGLVEPEVEDSSEVADSPEVDDDPEAADNSEVIYNSRSEELAATLLKSMSINVGGFYDRRLWLSENKKMVETAESISKSLGVVVLQSLSDAYNTGRDVFNSYSYQGDKTNNSADDKSIESMIQDVKSLQDKLDATEDDDEQRALEEDITGKILFTCWRGIHSEIEPILTEVVEHILKDGTVAWTVLSTRVAFLERFGRIFEGAIAEPPEGDQAHLRRIMADAEAGTSKHQLLLTELATRGVGNTDATISESVSDLQE